jgi:hypothetical protein
LVCWMYPKQIWTGVWWPGRPPVFSVYSGMEKLCTGWGFRVLKPWFLLVLFFCQVCWVLRFHNHHHFSGSWGFLKITFWLLPQVILFSFFHNLILRAVFNSLTLLKLSLHMYLHVYLHILYNVSFHFSQFNLSVVYFKLPSHLSQSLC